uniref:Uncharacterized protein n=1 Tax=Helicotheca tamesis TaxID=374047 RepID=A0A7S2MTX1_9STRA|mmetsp:Transcript_3410/g.4618  ORF Transcript_3410/g.4618 Transcript_3410/m.4618 type:complete len:173 (+) Transcript_3410:50-568(+)
MMPASSDDQLQSSLTPSSSPSCEREVNDSPEPAADAPGPALYSPSRVSAGNPKRDANAKKGTDKARGSDETSKQRERFIIFIRILFKCIDETDPQLRPLAKRIVKECTLRNREGHPGYQPLVEAVQSRLQSVVGDTHWKRAEEYLRYFVATRKRTARGRQALSSNPMDRKLE